MLGQPVGPTYAIFLYGDVAVSLGADKHTTQVLRTLLGGLPSRQHQRSLLKRPFKFGRFALAVAEIGNADADSIRL